MQSRYFRFECGGEELHEITAERSVSSILSSSESVQQLRKIQLARKNEYFLGCVNVGGRSEKR